MKAGDYPDVVHLATGRPAALTETLIKEDGLEDITDVLSMTVPGENVKVSDKIAGGFTDSSLTNPYGDGKTYMAPMFYSPCGLFYNAGLFEEKGWEVPKTWDEMWALGDKAKAEGIALFTYSFENSRLLYRSILWSTHDEENLHKWFSSNFNVEVHAYVKNGKYCVVNNTYEPQTTTVYRGDGSSFSLSLEANEIKWYEI